MRCLLFTGLLLVLPLPVLAAHGPKTKTSTRSVELESSLRFLRASSLEKPTLVAGTKGVLTVDFHLPERDWQPSQLELQIEPNAGIRFDDQTIALPTTATVAHAHLSYTVVEGAAVKNDISLQIHAVVTGTAAVYDAGQLSLPVRVDTPKSAKALVLIVIAIAIFLFVVEWMRVDVVAIMIMLALPILGVIDARMAFSGLSSNAVVIIIGVMIISAGFNRVGIVSRVVRPFIRAAGESSPRLMVFLSVLIALISSVMRNTRAAVLFLPGIRHACREMKTPISGVLMPIGMCAILGGTLTLIGTTPLIMVSDLLPAGMEKISLFELTPIGAALVGGGILYFATIGRVLLKRQTSSMDVPASETIDVRSFYHELAGPFELRVPHDFTPTEETTMVAIRRNHLTNIVCIAGDRGLYELAPAPQTKIRPGNKLCAYGIREHVEAFGEKYGIEIFERPKRFRDLFNRAVAGTVEAVVPSRSSIIGSTIREIGFRKTFGVTSLALFREGKTYYKEMNDIPLVSGDALLLHATWERFHALQEAHKNFTIITPLEVEIEKPAKSRAAVFSFLVALVLMLVSTFHFQARPDNPIPLSVCLMVGALGMVVLGVLSIRDAYNAVDWRTVFLLAGLIPLGIAVDRTGMAAWIATGLVSSLGDVLTPLILLIVLAVMSGALCLVISNVAACTLIVPLGISAAAQIGIDPRIAVVVVCLGVSNSFLLPTHQVNALYMGPGDYRTKDYMRIGGGLSLLYIAILVAMTYLFYM